MTKLAEQIAESAESHRKHAQKAEILMAHVAAVDRCCKTLSRFVKMSGTMVISGQILLRFEVAKLVDIEPVLEQIEQDLGVEFDKTSDHAELRWRTFESKTSSWLRVDAELAADGEECRRVVVGYDTVPRYELKCGEDAKTPDAARPETTSRFSEETEQ
jgi:hypothetical protein